MGPAVSVVFLLIAAKLVSGEEPFFLPIVGGNESDVNEFPFLVALVKDGGSRWNIKCGGSIINETHILTAAHCKPKDGEEIFVLAGAYNLSDKDSGQSVSISDFISHPDYSSSITGVADIAVVKLNESLPMRTTEDTSDELRERGFHGPEQGHGPELAAEPAVLNTDTDCPATSAECQVTGWGLTSEAGQTSDVRLRCSLFVYNRTRCQEIHDSSISITEGNMCAGTVEGGKDACQGDSGGPLICTCGQNEKVVVGVVSCGAGCGRADVPGIYTTVEHYMTWITGNEESSGGTACRCGWLFLLIVGLLVTVTI